MAAANGTRADAARRSRLRSAQRKAKAERRGVKPTGLLKSYADARKANNTLLGDIQVHLLAEHQKPSDRRQDILHPSEMAKADWCHRQSYYRLAGTPETDEGERFSFQLETIFAEGHEIHRKWQTWLRDMGRLWGAWECPQCKFGPVEMGPDPGECPGCNMPYEYKEVPLEAEHAYLIAGHEDGADTQTNALIEIKSIGLGTLRIEEPDLLREYRVETTDGKKIYDLEGLWKGLKHPLLSHRKQTGIYLALAKGMGLPFDKVTFLYEYKPTQSVKAFTVKYNHDLIKPLLDKALEVKYALAEKIPPPRPDHTGKETKVCKTCPFFTKCYADDKDRESSAASVPDDVPPRRSRRGRRLAGEAGDRPTGQAEAGRARTAPGSHRAKRLRTDESVLSDPGVGGVPQRATGSGNGVREVRRRGAR